MDEIKREIKADDTVSPMKMSEYQLLGQIGLTKREYFAGLALQGILARSEGISIKNGLFVNEANVCVVCADALIDALKKL